ncbi:MAG: zinc ribbon domain-containing protein [Oscillospiraceae bacterium]|jgi:predicted nucleic acid-binding Zn ribbon protein|nr:zinc ribbon domain-containing protein [Oscillospiraceae bacterium]
MAIFDEIGKKITNVGQSVVKGTKDITETARLNSQISDEQSQISRLYAEIGEVYYEQFHENAAPQLAQRCAGITAALERIAAYRQELQHIRGMTRCANCGAEIPAAAAFCGNCGAPAEVAAPVAAPPRKFCANCGAAVEYGAAFCQSCGQRAE